MKQLQIAFSRYRAAGKSMWLKALFFASLALLPLQVQAQQTTGNRVSLEVRELPLGEVLKTFGNASGYKINFSIEDVTPYRVSITLRQADPLQGLRQILQGKPLEFETDGNIITVRRRQPVAYTSRMKSVDGQVLDETGAPLPGANIRCVGSPYGAIADADGRFSCKVPEEAQSLEVSFVGMQTAQVSVSGRTSVRVVMREDKRQLDDVVVTGYQRISKERSTAAFGFLSADQLTARLNTNLSSSLEGMVAGLRMDINPNTGTMAPILRGVGTFSSDVGTYPLIVVDDMPTNLQLSDINPYNVESITVLKDAAAASIYGALAANGVIVIATKRGLDENPRITASADWFLSTKPNFDALHLASSGEIIDYQTDVFKANVADMGSIDGFLSSYKSSYYNPLFDLYRRQEAGSLTDTEVQATLNDWRTNDYYNEYRDRAWRTAVTQRYNLSLSQKRGDSHHFLSANYETNANRNIEDDANRFSLYYKSGYQVAKWLNLQAGIDVRIGREETPMNQYDSYDSQQRYERIFAADGSRYISPYAGVLSGSYNGAIVEQYEGVAPYKPFGFNVLDALTEGKTKTNRMNVRPFVNLQARFLKMFKYSFMYQYEWNKQKTKVFDAKDSYMMRMEHNSMVGTDGKVYLPEGGRLRQVESGSNRYTLRNQIDVEKAWLDHNLTAIAGLEFRETKTPTATTQLMYGYDPQTLTSEIMDWQRYRDGVGTSALSGSPITLTGLPATLQEVRHRYASFYANAGYSYLSRYNLSGSIRWDQADLFGLDIRNQRHPLWSVGAAWILSREAFMKELSWLDYLKLRMTYGINGNVDQSSTTYFIVKQRTQSNPIRSNYLNYDDNDLPNPKLRWEKTATYNVGIDFRLLENRLDGSLEYYNRHASDLLVRRYMDPTLGAKSRVVNNGEMRNRGIEFSLSADILRKKDWGFSAGFTFAHNANKMVKVDHSDADTSVSFVKSPRNYYIQGTAYNTLWAYRIGRIENGYPIAVDREGKDMVTFNEDGTVASIRSTSSLKGTDDLVNMGTLTPTFNGALTLKLNYKAFDLQAFFIYSGGNKLRNSVVSMNDVAGNQTLRDLTNRWSPEYSDSRVRMYFDMPAQTRSHVGTFQDWWQYGDIHVLDGSYAKLRSLSLGYSLPEAFCGKLHLASLRLQLQVSNIFTWSAAGRDIDPESYDLNGGSRGMAAPKTFSIGLSASF